MIHEEVLFIRCDFEDIKKWIELEFKKDYLPFIFKPKFSRISKGIYKIVTNVEFLENQAMEPVELGQVFYLKIIKTRACAFLLIFQYVVREPVLR